jgi:hypothetical protein
MSPSQADRLFAVVQCVIQLLLKSPKKDAEIAPRGMLHHPSQGVVAASCRRRRDRKAEEASGCIVKQSGL